MNDFGRCIQESHDLLYELNEIVVELNPDTTILDKLVYYLPDSHPELGYGYYSLCTGYENTDYAVKFGGLTGSLDGYVTFARYCMLHPENPFLPTVYHIHEDTQRDLYFVITELLDPMDEVQLEEYEYLTGFFDNILYLAESWEEQWEFMSRWYDDREVLQHLRGFLKAAEVNTDLHNENFMQDSSGQIKLIDPFTAMPCIEAHHCINHTFWE